MPERESGKLVCIRRFLGRGSWSEADLARNVLEEYGIPSSQAGGSVARLMPFAETIYLFVREEDALQAEDILAEYFDTPHPHSDNEPSS